MAPESPYSDILGLGWPPVPEIQFLENWTSPHPGGDSSIAGVRRAPPAEQNAPNPVRVIIGDNEVHPGAHHFRTCRRMDMG